MNVRRDSSMGINKGSRAYILDDPQGNTWVMKSGGLIVDPKQKFEDLKDLGSRLKLPVGWKFRSPILEQDLEFMTDNSKTMITQDELGNTYDLSVARTATTIRSTPFLTRDIDKEDSCGSLAHCC